MITKDDSKNTCGFVLFTKSELDGNIVIKLIVSLKSDLKNFIFAQSDGKKNICERMTITMNRSSDELVRSFNNRVSLNLKKHLENYIKNVLEKSLKLEVSFKVMGNDESIDDIPLVELLDLEECRFGRLNLGLDNKLNKCFYFGLKKNVDMIESVTLKNEIRLGLPLVPSLLFHKGNENNFAYKWYLQSQNAQGKVKVEQLSTLPENVIEIDNDLVCELNLKNISGEEVRNITENIENYSLILRIISKSFESDEFDSIYRFNKINSPIRRSWRDFRIENFKKNSDTELAEDSYNRLRIVTFNILSEFFAQTEKALKEMYPNCPIYALQPNYRRGILARELTDLEFDIICLQEVQTSLYYSFIEVLLKNRGYKGIFSDKYASVSTFYKEDMFELIETKTFLFRDLLKEDYSSLIDEIKCKWPDFIEKLLNNISTVYQITVLKHRKSSIIYIVGNTHLYYHQYGGHVRIIQVKLIMDLVESFIANTKSKYKAADIIPFIMGDFNTLPFSDARKLLMNGKLSSNSTDWLHSQVFSNRDIPDSFENEATNKLIDTGNYGINLCTSSRCIDLFNINIDEKYDNITVIEKDNKQRIKDRDSIGFDENLYYPFTNKVQGFSGQLDYIYLVEQTDIMERYEIFINKYLEYIQEDALAPVNTIPNPVYPSDHISVGIDITFRIKQQK